MRFIKALQKHHFFKYITIVRQVFKILEAAFIHLNFDAVFNIINIADYVISTNLMFLSNILLYYSLLYLLDVKAKYFYQI